MATQLASHAATIAGSTRITAPRREYTRGDEIGRYVILSVLGEGGMGIVYAAYDPELDRKVAVKLLHVEERDRGPHTEGVTRMQREAQALARLTHPNVLTIHDVGVHSGHVFLAMEFVEGGTLTDWLAREERSPEAILNMFVTAGQGLVAAHDVGLVHRDFKPDNVLVGEDGRPRVADFGLAVGRGSSSTGSRDALEESLNRSLEHKLTVTGRAVGTPYYMAPEQFLDSQVDAAADQFAFCVALYDALYKQHPFGGDTVAELRMNLLSGMLREPPTGIVSAPARRALLQGLQVDPSVRHPSLAALLEQLKPARKARKVPVVAISGVAAAALVGGYFLAADTPDPCPRANDRIEQVWGAKVQEKMHQQFSQSPLPYRERAWSSVAESLDRYTDTWLDAHTDVCEDTRVRGELSEAMLDQRMICLEERLDSLGTLVELMLEADDRTVEKSVIAAETLPRIERCHNIAAMRAASLNLPEPEVVALRKQLLHKLNAARALRQLGHVKDARDRYEAMEEEIFATDDRVVHAVYRRHLASVRSHFNEDEKAEELLFAALADTSASGDAGEAARVAIGFMDLHSTYETNVKLIDQWHQVAKGFLVRHGQDVDLELKLIRRYGSALRRVGEGPRALEAHKLAVEMHERLVGPDHYNTLVSHYNLGAAHWQVGNFDDVEKQFNYVVSRWPERIGETHPTAISALSAGGVIAIRRGRYKQAVADLELVLERRIALYGADHRSIDDTREALGTAYLSARRYEDARREFDTVLENRKRYLGADNRYVGWALGNVSSVNRQLGNLEVARDAALQSREILRKVHKKDHPEVAKSYLMMARIEADSGDPAAAREALDTCINMLVKTGYETHPDLAEAHLVLTNLALDDGEAHVAEKEFSKVLALDDGKEQRPDALGDFRGIEAKIAWLKGDKQEAGKRKREAISLYKQLDGLAKKDIDKLEKWFADHG